MVLFRPLVRLLIRVKGRMWVALTAFRIYQRLPQFARRRVRKRAIRAALPHLFSKLTGKERAGPSHLRAGATGCNRTASSTLISRVVGSQTGRCRSQGGAA